MPDIYDWTTTAGDAQHLINKVTRVAVVCFQGAPARSEVSSSQGGTSHQAAKAGDAQQTIKSMAASLFRAFDEGRLKERAPALADLSGELNLVCSMFGCFMSSTHGSQVTIFVSCL